MSYAPQNGNEFFTEVRNIAGNIQRVKSDEVKTTSLTSAFFTPTVVNVGPTGSTGPYNSAPVQGQVVFAATGPAGPGPVIAYYTGSNWVFTSPLTR